MTCFFIALGALVVGYIIGLVRQRWRVMGMQKDIDELEGLVDYYEDEEENKGDIHHGSV